MDSRKPPIINSRSILDQVTNAKNRYSNIRYIVNEETLLNWKETLDVYTIPVLYIRSSPYNLVKVLFAAEFQIETRTDFEPLINSVKILITLNIYLYSFPSLMTDKSFLDKIRNIGGFIFLSTLSELSVANFF